MSFEFTEPTTALLTSVTPRTEKHGDEDVFAISVGLCIEGPNTLLDKLSPTLRQALYKPADESTDPLPGVEQATPLLRAPGIEVLKLKGQLQGWTFGLAHGIEEDPPIKLGDAKVDSFRVEPLQGGSIKLHFRVGSNDIDATEAGLICAKLRQEIDFTLTAPVVKDTPRTEATGAEIDGTVGHPGAAGAAEGQGSLLDDSAPRDDGLGTFADDMARGADPDDDDQADDEGSAPDADADGFEAGAAQAIAKARVKPARGKRAVAH